MFSAVELKRPNTITICHGRLNFAAWLTCGQCYRRERQARRERRHQNGYQPLGSALYYGRLEIANALVFLQMGA